ncbi:MAG: bifunctional hydroxymethylpyrimidine kinase/phosphomethylpyrimidine kinase [Armatimonadota bacterium]|nr:bifunctional hydroxymethylpyrimidine kinase/phosphomethylpyrimidine kinase [Armatimonadota bacterium]MDR7438341.1 bifunctional hydroxymethylpyrimidine kinase/phosphomethylpyrimidine kinase [Armatimonadota bacterium]MDR7443337.1 bifunctional hydroxymethylpyrimidine kinase/phosphomethylpyrimidine kinase [Armatimonadota bacterium]MDR7563393.1 bifunctional hydroxymethylpyrimidine kinase/phosphomethylpyrimidine kinase [Armatimonadota bacterium]MDR7567132.1 bifunctional hydroxymethylpyrimidine kin
MTVPRALTIAGSDSGGGAGIQADLKTFSALGVFGMSAITAITAQNTTGVYAVHEVPPEVVAAQIDAVVTDIGVDAAKTGMLSSAPIIEVVADRIRAHRITRLVVDPVMVAKSGAPLLRPEAREALRMRLLPLALVVTPNLPEAQVLVGREIRDLGEMKEAARRIADLGPRFVLLKGGHLPGHPVDVLYDGEEFSELGAARIPTKHTHGTGCVLSAAIAAYLSRGLEPREAIRQGKGFVTRAIEAGLPLGKGFGPCNPLFSLIRTPEGGP